MRILAPPRTCTRVLLAAHRLFPALWTLVKPFLHQVVRDKTFVLGANYRDTLLEHIPAHALPVEYGGTCVCEGGCVPLVRPELLESGL